MFGVTRRTSMGQITDSESQSQRKDIATHPSMFIDESPSVTSCLASASSSSMPISSADLAKTLMVQMSEQNNVS